MSRVANSRRKSRSASTMRRSAMKCDRVVRAASLPWRRGRRGTPSAYGRYRPRAPGWHANARGREASPGISPAAGERPALPLDLTPDELVDQVTGGIVAVLLGRRLHEVRRCRQDRAADAAVAGNLGGPDGIDDHAGRVRRVPDLQLVLKAQRHVAEGPALEPDVSEFP